MKKCANQDYIPPLEIFLASANDSALNTFLNLPKLDEDTTDLLLKLGRTLRNKGEIERSIHLHQSLFARTDLARETWLRSSWSWRWTTPKQGCLIAPKGY